MSRPRIALYSPGMVGLGHLRRNLLIAQSLVSSGCSTTLLLVAEAREAGALTMPAGVDCLTLPALQKDANGDCHARYWDWPFDQTVALRARIIETALSEFDPDVLIVDHLPMGAGGELAGLLSKLRSRGRARLILGLRDVVEAPEIVRERWQSLRYTDAIAEYYDAVWVYGDPNVYNAIHEYDLPGIVAEKIVFTGYLDSRARLRLASERDGLLDNLGPISDPFALCLVGGGSDGGPIAEAFIDAELPDGVTGVVVTGPFMPPDVRQRLHRKAEVRPRQQLLGFISEPAFLVARAERIVTMGGYNNVCDVLSFEKPALVIPRVQPRCEQLIRATRLKDFGLIDVMLPQDVTSGALTRWLHGKPTVGARVRERVDVNGLSRLPALIREFLEPQTATAGLATASPHARRAAK